MKVDAHVHIWDKNFKTHADHPLPPIEGTASDLITNMDAAGVHKAIVIQPINYKFDHECVSSAMQRFPQRLVGVALADTTQAPEAAKHELTRLVAHGFRGIRINPTFTADGFRSPCVSELVARAGELNIPVALFARPQHLEDVEHLLKRHPHSKVLLDHFAFAPGGEGSEEAQQRVLELAKYSNVYVKTSAWFRVSAQEWPHRDLHRLVRALVDSFGAHRLLLGSDYPFVKEQYEYKTAMSIVELVGLSAEERQWVGGGTAAALYNI